MKYSLDFSFEVLKRTLGLEFLAGTCGRNNFVSSNMSPWLEDRGFLLEQHGLAYFA